MNISNLRAAIRSWVKTALLIILLGGSALSISTSHALAHASLIAADPADGAVVAAAPKSFALTFNEPTSPLVLKLVRPDGSSLALDRFVLRDTTLDIEAPSGLGNGTHVLSWRVISEDGHPVGGSVVFSIGAPSAGGAPTAVEAIDWPVRSGIWLTKVALYCGLFLGVGGVFFTSWVGGRSRQTSILAAVAIVVGFIATLLSIGLQGLDALDLSLRGLAKPTVWTAGFENSYGATASIAGAALVIGLIALRLKGGIAKALSLLAFMGAGLALAASGHASAAHPQWLTRPAVFLHGLGIAFWAGSLVPLGTALSLRRDAIPVLRRFSRTIPFAVFPLVATGLVLAVVQVQTVDALWATAYGRVLVAKLVLLLALFLLAAVNRFWLTKPSLHGEAEPTLRLRHAIRAEILLVVAIFAVAAVWRFTPPPRALAEAAAAPASVHIHTSKAMADVTIAPGRVGPVRASIMVMTGDFGPLEAKEVTLVLADPAAGIEPIKRPATRTGDGMWSVDNLNIPVAGRWSVRLDILVSDFELVRLEDRIEFRP